MGNFSIKELSRKKIAILGFGQEGRALFDFLKSKDIEDITIFDESGKPEPTINLIISDLENIHLETFDLVFRSPGINPKRLSGLSNITSATNLFFELCPGKIIGVTGTKGKSTTSMLIEKLLKLNGKEVFIGGNIGEVPLSFLDKLKADSYTILELSSFQLQDLKYSPQISVVLPITSDHLDYHNSEEDYVRAKSSICSFQKRGDLTIYYYAGHTKEIASLSAGRKISFSDSISCDGCFVAGQDIRCTGLDGEAVYKSAAEYSQSSKIPLANILAVTTLGYAEKLSVDLNEICNGFKKMPFRIELVKEAHGVKFYNDSASTNPVSTIAAISTFNEPYILIAGGSSKNLSYTQLATELKRDPNLYAIFLTGDTAKEINQALFDVGYAGEVQLFDSLDGAVFQLKDHINKIKAVLFSPASASFDSFENYIKRGEYFSTLINKL